MDIIKDNKNIIVGLIIFAIAFFVYNAFLRSDGSLLLSAPSTTGTGAALLKMSEDLKQTDLSQELFSSPGFVRLADFTVPVPDLPLGRPNPFSPIGSN